MLIRLLHGAQAGAIAANTEKNTEECLQRIGQRTDQRHFLGSRGQWQSSGEEQKMTNREILRRAKVEKLTKEILNSQEYKKRRAQDDEQYLMRAFASFALISADYLYRQFNCKAAGIRKFIDFVKPSMGYVKDDPDYFRLMNEAFVDEIGLDVMKELGMEFEK